MKLKPLREWSDDALWIAFGITLTIAVCFVVMVTMPP